MGTMRRSTGFVCQSCLNTLDIARLQSRIPRALSNRASMKYSTSLPWQTRRHSTHSTLSPPLIRAAIPSLPHKKAFRAYSTEQNNLAPSRPAPKGLTPLPSRRLICLSGADAAKFLQGLISNNVDPNRKSPFYAAFLDARGRVLWDVFIWTYPELIREEWVCYIEVDGAEVEALLKHLKKHKLRSKLQIKLVDEDEMGVYAAWGIGAEELQSSLLIASLEDPRATGFGFRCLYKGSLSKENAMPPIPALDAEQYTLRRYLFGIPEGPSEIPRESALPMETNIDLSSGIDFQKGCYVGQELTIRTKHTGVVRKRVLPVQLYRNGDPVPAEDTAPTFDPSWNDTIESGTDIKQLDEEGGIRKGRAAGKFLGGIGNVGLAVCRLEMMTSMRVSAEGGSWRPGAEFGIQGTENADGEPVRVKAFVPPWFSAREKDMWRGSKGRAHET